jgi:hypothetical protein
MCVVGRRWVGHVWITSWKRERGGGRRGGDGGGGGGGGGSSGAPATVFMRKSNTVWVYPMQAEYDDERRQKWWSLEQKIWHQRNFDHVDHATVQQFVADDPIATILFLGSCTNITLMTVSSVLPTPGEGSNSTYLNVNWEVCLLYYIQLCSVFCFSM